MMSAVAGLLLLTGWCCSLVTVGCAIRAAYAIAIEDAPLRSTAALWSLGAACGAMTLVAIAAAVRMQP